MFQEAAIEDVVSERRSSRWIRHSVALMVALVYRVVPTDGDKTLMPVLCRLPVPAAFVTDHPLPSCS